MKKKHRHNRATPSLSRGETRKLKRTGEKKTRREGRKECKNGYS